MKKYFRHLIIICVFCLVLFCPLVVSAEEPLVYDWPIYPNEEEYPFGDITEDIDNYYRYMQANHGFYSGIDRSQMNVLVMYDKGHDCYNFIYLHNINPFVVSGNMAGYVSYVDCPIGFVHNNSTYICAVAVLNSSGVLSNVTTVSGTFEFTPAEDIIFYCNTDVYSSEDSTLLCITNKPAFDGPSFSDGIFENLFTHDSDVFFESLQVGVDSANNTIQNTTLESTDDTDNKFLGIFQNMGTIFSNMYTQLETIAHSVTEFSNTFFNNVVGILQHGFNGLKTAIDTLISNLYDLFPDFWKEIIEDLYNSGLDNNGVFSFATLFDYWLVPDENFLNEQYVRIEDSISFVVTIKELGNTLHYKLSTIEAKSPVFTIPAGTYGIIVLNEDYSFNFDWFLKYKKYTDPVIAAFLYVGVLWRLYAHLPGIIGGVTGFVSSDGSKLSGNGK